MDSVPGMDGNMTRYEALKACRDAAGSDSQMARDLSVPQSTMWRWLNQTKQLPAEYVLRAEDLYGVSRHNLRPDIYPLDRSRQRRSNRKAPADRQAAA